jgi:ABC-type multidrug transport system fused ATPase/permease subunit
MINPVIPESVARPYESRFSGFEQFLLVLRVLRYTRLVWDKILLRLITTQISAFLITVPAALGIRIIDEAFVLKDFALFMQLGVLVAAAILLTKILDFTNDSMAVYGVARVGVQLRIDIVRHLLSLSPRFYESRPIGEHMYRCIYDASDVQMIINDLLPRAIMNLQKVLALAVVLASIRLWLLPVCAVYLVVFFAVKQSVATRIRVVDRHERREAQRVEALTRELFAAFKLVKGYNLENMARRWYWTQLSKKLRRTFQKSAWFAFDLALNSPTTGFAFPALILLLNFIAGRQIILGNAVTLTVGEYTAIAVLVGQLALPIQDAIALFQETRQRLVPTERMMDTMEVEPEIKDAPDATVLHDPIGHIEVRDISFAYEKAPVLCDVSFEARPGEKIAIVGPIGAGKSTLVRLLLRLADPHEGEIRIDGMDIRSITHESLRRSFGVVPQNTVLFSESLEDNIRRAVPDASRERVEEAARLAGVTEFVDDLPNGYDTPIHAGSILSGGQRQRVCLARALVKDAPVLVLDEATSALDPVSEQQVVAALDVACAGRTRIVIAHNLLNARTADRIYVLDKGTVVEFGTHDDLMRAGGRYAELWKDED